MTIQDIYSESVAYRLRSGKSDDPYVHITQTDIVRNSKILLQEIPDRFNSLKITDANNNSLSIIDSGIPDSTKVVVDWVNGILTFADILNGQTYTISYFGRGATFMPSSKIYTQMDDNGNVVETLKQLIDQIKSLNGQIQDLRIGDMTTLQTTTKAKVVDAINETLGKMGGLAQLQTTDKTNLVNAINENKLKVSNTAPTDGSLFWVDTSV